jgi:hypothetical protein
MIKTKCAFLNPAVKANTTLMDTLPIKEEKAFPINSRKDKVPPHAASLKNMDETCSSDWIFPPYLHH